MRGPALVLILAGLWSWSGIAALDVARTVGDVLPQALSAVDQVLIQVDAALTR